MSSKSSNVTAEDSKRLKTRLDEEVSMLNGGSYKRNIRDEDVRTYNFREPDKFSKSQLSTLNMLFDNFCREAATTLTTTVQSNCELEVSSIEQKPYNEILKNMSEITALNLIQIKPLEGQAIIEISLDTVQTIVNKVFGGQGSVTTKAKDLTTIERGVLKRVINELLKVLTICFQNLDIFEMNLDRIETNPQFVQQVAPQMEICVKVSMNLKISNSKSSNIINIILPFLMLEPLLPKLTSSSVWLSKIPKKSNTDEVQKKIEGNLHNAEVDFKVEIGKTKLTLEDIESIEVGDIIPLESRIDEPLTCFVENKRIAKATAGIYKSKKAVMIEELID